MKSIYRKVRLILFQMHEIENNALLGTPSGFSPEITQQGIIFIWVHLKQN